MKTIRLSNEVTTDAIDAARTMYPSRVALHSLRNGQMIKLGNLSTFYLVVLSGLAACHFTDEHGDVKAGQPTVIAGPRDYVSGVGAVVEGSSNDLTVVAVFERVGFRGQRAFGSVEDKGRLSYIDGCSDTMLVYPPRAGDPVFNHLHFPPGIVQTQHLHPSIRLGVVLYGKGKAWGPGWELDLEPGVAFMLDEQEIHSFRTDTSEDVMGVIAYHPDSDWGPVDANHPMLNRTYIRHGGGAR